MVGVTYVVASGPLWWASWSSLLNYVGSVFFLATAIADFTLPTTGEPFDSAIVNSGTFLGATCFLVVAHVLLPPTPRRHESA